MNTKLIKDLTSQLLLALPPLPRGTVVYWWVHDDGTMYLRVCMGDVAYETARAWLTACGAQDKSKHVYTSGTDLRTSLDGIDLSVNCSGIPPTCRRVTKTKRVPRETMVVTDEFVEIEETVIECGEEKGQV